MKELVVRRAREEDVAAAAKLAAALVRMHHAFDPSRFLAGDRVEEGYAWWLARERARDEAIVLVAEDEGAIVGYAYATLEGRDWVKLLDAHGALHDVYVDPNARRHGVGRALVEATVKALEELGAPRVVLATAAQNEPAQKLFEKLGFRPTMLEMTRDVEP